ncbi:platelet glycoprotein Ib beta chain isoform X2 [Corythoichthys intestinalis]|uniref:platelet glycoprotein Ib beta chain isoform X2 n=1 Tax=Corythoichthys intestinalis TaxID=161448 RepID=UPI0025A4E184|nr:platelet glycoprotein Ib beta chain isoform X2 [Corythoichthys intestinalis]
MSLLRMKEFHLLCLLIFGGRSSLACPQHCTCQGSQVDCSARSLVSAQLPSVFPAYTAELRLHNNRLTTLPNGLLDHLPALRQVSLHSNPWACDCGVLYLRAWLRRQPAGSQPHVNCSSPPRLRGRLVEYLTEEEVLDSCHYWYCDLAMISQAFLFVFVLVQVALLAAVIVFLKKFERLSKEAKRTEEESLTAGEANRKSVHLPLNEWSS